MKAKIRNYFEKYNFIIINLFWNLLIALFIIKINSSKINDQIVAKINDSYDKGYDYVFLPLVLFLIAQIIYYIVVWYNKYDIDTTIYTNAIVALTTTLIIPFTLFFTKNEVYNMPSKLFGFDVPFILLVLSVWIPFIIMQILILTKNPKKR
jgi:hypothetical protein